LLPNGLASRAIAACNALGCQGDVACLTTTWRPQRVPYFREIRAFGEIVSQAGARRGPGGIC
jgi:hypothetical protein